MSIERLPELFNALLDICQSEPMVVTSAIGTIAGISGWFGHANDRYKEVKIRNCLYGWVKHAENNSIKSEIYKNKLEKLMHDDSAVLFILNTLEDVLQSKSSKTTIMMGYILGQFICQKSIGYSLDDEYTLVRLCEALQKMNDDEYAKLVELYQDDIFSNNFSFVLQRNNYPQRSLQDLLIYDKLAALGMVRKYYPTGCTSTNKETHDEAIVRTSISDVFIKLHKEVNTVSI